MTPTVDFQLTPAAVQAIEYGALWAYLLFCFFIGLVRHPEQRAGAGPTLLRIVGRLSLARFDNAPGTWHFPPWAQPAPVDVVQAVADKLGVLLPKQPPPGGVPLASVLVQAPRCLLFLIFVLSGTAGCGVPVTKQVVRLAAGVVDVADQVLETRIHERARSLTSTAGWKNLPPQAAWDAFTKGMAPLSAGTAAIVSLRAGVVTAATVIDSEGAGADKSQVALAAVGPLLHGLSELAVTLKEAGVAVPPGLGEIVRLGCGVFLAATSQAPGVCLEQGP